MKQLPKPVVMYLEKLELALKRRVGVSPEDELCDAREHLCRHYLDIQRRYPEADDDQAVAMLSEGFGDPEEVATQFGTAEKSGIRIPGYAPGWRLCCTRCGRGAPAAKLGITRIVAFGEKHTVGWCSKCGFLRWMKLVRDLDRPTLTQALGVDRSADQLRSKNRPWTFVIGLVAAILVTVFIGRRVVARAVGAGVHPAESCFEEMPAGWQLTKSMSLSGDELLPFCQKFGVEIERLSNNRITDGSGTMQINAVHCDTEKDARKLYKAFSALHDNPRDCILNGRTVYEFVLRGGDASDLFARARYELGLQPKSQKYVVEFDAAPVIDGEYANWNRLFNLFLEHQAGRAVDQQIMELARGFEFGDRLLLKKSGIGQGPSHWTCKPAATETLAGDANVSFRFVDLDRRVGVPSVSVVGRVLSETDGKVPLKGEVDPQTTEATKYWPVGDAQVQSLVKEIVRNAPDDEAKLSKLLNWFRSEMRYHGEPGSRYGVRRVFEQKHGHCWDYSDLFVTLARAARLPATQVYGWLYEGQGHVWCRVLVDGRRRQVDPTTGTKCGSDYVPFVVSLDGRMPILYQSMPAIRCSPGNPAQLQ